VVERDRSMEALIDNGEEWMEPMLNFRDFLAETQDPERKKEVRDYRRRDGQVKVRKKQGTLIRGPYTLEFRKTLLRKLLQVQQDVRRDGPEADLTLISAGELFEIRRLWRVEAQDWDDSVRTIYQEETHDTLLVWPEDDAALFGADERALLAQVCAEEAVPLDLMMALIEGQRQQGATGSRSAVHARIDEIMRSEWRSEAEVLEAVEAHQRRRTGSEQQTEFRDALH
jgi:DNA sulfur modification protein DndC